MDKILIIHPSLGSGGAEKIIAFLANTLSEQYNVRLQLLKNDQISLPINQFVELVYANCYDNQPILGRAIVQGIKRFNSLVSFIRQQYREYLPDLVICFDLRVLLATYIALGNDCRKILFSERADPFINKKYWQVLLKHIYPRISCVVFQTIGAQNFYGNKIARNSCIIANPALSRLLKTEKYCVETRENFIFSAGRFQHRKGFDLLIQAFSECASVHSDLKLVLYGQGQCEESLHQLVLDLQIEDRVVINPPMLNVIEANCNARLFVLPSRSEGIPNILIEAMLAGIPCVATDCTPGGARLLSDNGMVCLLAENDNVASLAKQIKFAIDNPQIMKQMSDNAKISMERFEPKRIAKEWLNIVHKQINKEK